ncbi:MAG: glycosyltransferase family 39 protein, partial [Planctomycetaceae bacterium]|nr:glycosyltransferase family 39 protein [Planctomycetaceae bacterium]
VNRTEVAHVGAAAYFYQTFRYDVFHVNPPLTRYITGLPILLSAPQYDWKNYSPRPQDRSEWSVGSSFINANTPEKYHWCAFLARCSLIPIILLGGYFGYKFASELYGQASGLIFLLLWTSSPLILGWGATVCPDVCAAALGIIGVYTFWHWLKNQTWGNTITSGICLGLLPLVKITWVIAFPLWFLIWLIWMFDGKVLRDKRNISNMANQENKIARPNYKQLVIVFLISIYVLNMGYSFDGTFRLLKDYKFISRTLSGIERPDGQNSSVKTGNRFENSLLGYVPVPLPAEFVQGIDTQKLDFERGIESYFCGTFSQHGWWYYYFYTILIKEPLGNLCLGLFALLATCFLRGYNANWQDEMIVILTGLVLFIFVSSQTGFSLHPRYIVLVLPFAYIWISKLGQSFAKKHTVAGKAIGFAPEQTLRDAALAVFSFANYKTALAYILATITTILLCWTITSSVYYFPHSMSYFNELIGGAKKAPKHLLGSNIDWGQNSYFLKNWYMKNYATQPNRPPLKIAYSSSIAPEHLGIKNHESPNSQEPEAGWYAIGVNELYGSSKQYDWLKQFKLVDMIGYSIYIYHITPNEANHARQQMGLPERKETENF